MVIISNGGNVSISQIMIVSFHDDYCFTQRERVTDVKDKVLEILSAECCPRTEAMSSNY